MTSGFSLAGLLRLRQLQEDLAAAGMRGPKGCKAHGVQALARIVQHNKELPHHHLSPTDPDLCVMRHVWPNPSTFAARAL